MDQDGDVDLVDFDRDGRLDIVDLDQDGRMDQIDGRANYVSMAGGRESPALASSTMLPSQARASTSASSKAAGRYATNCGPTISSTLRYGQ